METEARYYVAGHRGLVGSACVRALQAQGARQILTRTRSELDLTDRQAVSGFFEREKPDYVIAAAAKVGGILANSTYPVDFLLENLEIQNNLFRAAAESKVRKMVFLGSSCIYPKFAPQPIPESSLLTGLLEPTNQWYALAKIAGIRLGQAFRQQYGMNFISAMPTNLYGQGDNFDLQTSHVLPALIRKFHEAKARGDQEVTLWGSGLPRREFLYVDDLAEAILFLLDRYDEAEHINVGTGEDLTIAELAEKVKVLTGFAGQVQWDTSKPDGTPRKVMDVSRIQALGWRARTSLDEGLKKTYDWWVQEKSMMT
jgi:GDP-L-fucose synthase